VDFFLVEAAVAEVAVPAAGLAVVVLATSSEPEEDPEDEVSSSLLLIFRASLFIFNPFRYL